MSDLRVLDSAWPGASAEGPITPGAGTGAASLPTLFLHAAFLA
jgi:hypothetical protein